MGLPDHVVWGWPCTEQCGAVWAGLQGVSGAAGGWYEADRNGRFSAYATVVAADGDMSSGPMIANGVCVVVLVAYVAYTGETAAGDGGLVSPSGLPGAARKDSAEVLDAVGAGMQRHIWAAGGKDAPHWYQKSGRQSAAVARCRLVRGSQIKPAVGGHAAPPSMANADSGNGAPSYAYG